MILVTGGAGFIGTNFVHHWLSRSDEPIVNLDKLTYAGHLIGLESLREDPRHVFVRGDIDDTELTARLLADHAPRAVVHFAAESHVDRSIHGPEAFIQTNVVGTQRLLEAVRAYLATLPQAQRTAFRFLHISTDEVYGSLTLDDQPFTEATPYAPNSPYAASKAASDHLVRAYHHTYGLPVLTVNCSNNYGPYQLPEKLIPLAIHRVLSGEPIPIYGDGKNIRDWLYVSDHCAAISSILQRGRLGETYNVGGKAETTNLHVIAAICGLLDELAPDALGRPHSRLIRFVADRPGHDRRYAIDAGKLRRELGWLPIETFDSGLRKTVAWYLANRDWTAQVASGEYRQWIDRHYDVC